MISFIRGYFAKKREAREWAAEQALLTQMAQEGWRSWERYPPYDRNYVWAVRTTWRFPEMLNPKDMSPEMNVNGLYWKPWG